MPATNRAKRRPPISSEIRYRPRDPNVEFSLPAAIPLRDDLNSIVVTAEEARNKMDGAIDAESVHRETIAS
jgi:hypothetical protein